MKHNYVITEVSGREREGEREREKERKKEKEEEGMEKKESMWRIDLRFAFGSPFFAMESVVCIDSPFFANESVVVCSPSLAKESVVICSPSLAKESVVICSPSLAKESVVVCSPSLAKGVVCICSPFFAKESVAKLQTCHCTELVSKGGPGDRFNARCCMWYASARRLSVSAHGSLSTPFPDYHHRVVAHR
jgi:hypothetical protein